MQRVDFEGDVTERERQIIRAIIASYGTLMMMSFGVAQNAGGLTETQQTLVVTLTKEFGEKHFPELRFWVE
jgi:hypothetical protein